MQMNARLRHSEQKMSVDKLNDNVPNFYNFQNCWHITATHLTSIFHAAKGFQMQYTPNIKNVVDFNIEIESPLELRLVPTSRPFLRSMQANSKQQPSSVTASTTKSLCELLFL